MTKTSTYLVIALVVMAFAATAHAGIKKGPYIQKVYKDEVTIVWETESSTGGSVEWGTDDLLGQKMEAAPGTIHEVTLTGLEADSAYKYKVTGDGDSSSVYNFWTAPKPETPFRVILFGDSRSGYSEHRKIVDAMIIEEPDLYLNTGDLVGHGDSLELWQEHFNIEKELAATTMLLPVIGNHDLYSGDAENYKMFFALPPLTKGEIHEHDENYYYMDYGNARFIALDGEAVSLAIGSPQHEWLLATLQNAASDPNILHIFVMAHEPPFTAKAARSGNAHLRAMMSDFEKYNVTAIFSGHDHHYYRGVSSEGINFIISGGGGAGLYDCDPRADYGVVNYICEKINHYVVFDINGPNIHAEAKTASGEVLETFDWVSAKQVSNSTEQPDDNSTDTPGDTNDNGGSSAVAQDEYDPNFGFSGCQSTGTTASFIFALAFVGLFVVIRKKSKENN